MSEDFRVNAERAIDDRPPPSHDDGVPAAERPWHGSATSEIAYWRARAQRAEQALQEILRANRAGA